MNEDQDTRDLRILGVRTLRRARVLVWITMLGHALWLLLAAIGRLDYPSPQPPLIAANVVVLVLLLLAFLIRRWRTHACIASSVLSSGWAVSAILVTWSETYPTLGYWATLVGSVTALVAANAWAETEV